MILLLALLATSVCASDGQPYVENRQHEIEIGLCGSSEKPVVRRVEFIVDRPQQSTRVDVSVDKRWSIALTAKELGDIQSIRAPAAAARVTLHAPHYRDASADLTKTPVKAVLRRLPVIRGRVASPSGQAVAGASIQTAPGDPPCITSADGAFACEIAGEWPRSIAIAVPGMATKIVAIDRGERDVDLGDLQMSRGAALTIRIKAPEQIHSATLILSRDDVALVERKVSLPLTEPLSISNLEPGTLRLLLKGSRPLQQRAANVVIKDGDNDQSVSIEESQLTLLVFTGARPEAGASIVLKNYEAKWSGATETDENGSAVEPVWQLGTFTAAVRAKNAASPVLDHREFTAGEKQQWTFHLPIARIEGVVHNEEGASVPNAEVNLTTDDGDMTTSLHTNSDADGRYAFDGVRPGSQTVAASADGYLPTDAVQFKLVQNEELRRADLTLHRGKRAVVDIVDHRGFPLAGAAVFATVDGAVMARVRSDGSGRAEVRLPESGSPVVFVIPVSGSFAIHRVTPVDRQSSAMRINVADPAASLQLKTETTEHKPVRDVQFLVRYDGESIPIDVLIQMPPFRTGADGLGTISNLPLGLYEFWPYSRAVDPQMNDAPAPLRIALAAGENSATLTFRTPHR